MQSVLESDQELTKRWDSEEPIRKQTDIPKSETEVKHAKFWQKRWVSTTSYITENVFYTSSRNTSARFIDISIPSSFSFYQLVGSHVWSLTAKELNVQSLTHRNHSSCLSCRNAHCPALSKRFHVDHWRGRNKIKRMRPIKRCCGWCSKEWEKIFCVSFKSDKMQSRKLEWTTLQNMTKS